MKKTQDTMISEETARATQKLAALCAKAEHSTGEMEQKLRQWGIPAEDRQTVIDYLVTNHYVDDTRYTEAFVEDKIRFNQWGRRKIEQALYAKGVPAAIYAPVLDRVSDSAYLDQLRPLLKAKWPTIHANSDYERSMKLIKFAMGRGYSLDLIRQCIDSVSEEDLDDHGELD